MKFKQSFVLAVIVLMAIATSGFSKTKNSNQTTDSLKTVNVKVKGITCSMDLKMISANVEKEKGVSSCKSGKQGTTTTYEVKYNPALVTEKEIFSTIENTESCENLNNRPYKIKQ